MEVVRWTCSTHVLGQQYRRRDPADADETEFMENVFDTLCSTLGEPENKKLFLDSEGVDLMVLMLKYAFTHTCKLHLLTSTPGRRSNQDLGRSKFWTMLCLGRLVPLAAKSSLRL